MDRASTGAVFKGERSRKFLKASKTATDYQKQYYEEVADRANQGEPVIWTNVGIPQEIMHANSRVIHFYRDIYICSYLSCDLRRMDMKRPSNM